MMISELEHQMGDMPVLLKIRNVHIHQIHQVHHIPQIHHIHQILQIHKVHQLRGVLTKRNREGNLM